MSDVDGENKYDPERRLHGSVPNLKIAPDASSGFRIHKISFSGAAGAVVGICAIAVLIEGVPSLRWPFLFSLIAGCLFALGLVLTRRWSKRTASDGLTRIIQKVRSSDLSDRR
jgi:hypothetical protein